MLYEDETHTREKLQELRRTTVCAVCKGRQDVFMDFDKHLAFLACLADRTHEGIEKAYEPKPFAKEGYGAYNIPTRREMMEKQYGSENTRALEKYHGVVSLTKADARTIITTIWPAAENASPEEVFKAITICTQYGLNPLMRHLFLIPYWNKDKGRYDYSCVLGITTPRLIASRKHKWSFLDDTPRISTEEEEIKHYRQLNPDKLRAIAKLRDLDTGAEVTAWGEWPIWKRIRQGDKVPNEPKGMDKGNSMENMACIHAERKGLDMLFPADMPSPDIPVMDEKYGDVVEGEVTAEEPIDEQPEFVEEPDGTAEEPIEPEESPGGGAGSEGSETKEGEENPKKIEPPAERDPASLTSLVDMFKACNQDFKNAKGEGMQPKDIIKELGYSDQFAITESPAECYRKIKSVRG